MTPSENGTAGRPRFCPGCGTGLEEVHDFVQPYMAADERIYHLWCHRCGLLCEVAFVERVIAWEPEH